MQFLSLVIFFSALVFSTLAHAQSFDGKYEGKMILTKGGAECGASSDVFLLEVKGSGIRISSQRAEKPLEGRIQNDGQLFAGGTGRGNFALEWRAQILATKTGLGTLLLTGNGIICQFLLSLKRS